MSGREALVLVAGALAVARLTRFVTSDTLTLGLRLAVAQRFKDHRRPAGGAVRSHWLVEVVHCDWCFGIWAAALVAGLLLAAGLLPDWRVAILGWLAMAGGAGLLLDAVRA